MSLVRFIIRWWVAFALLAAILALGGAHASETFGGLAPCHLCYKQRDVYWLAIAVALPATLWALFFRSKGTPKLAAFILFALFATGAIIATYHAGVEQKWWPGPASCTGTGGAVSLEQMQAIMSGKKVHVPMCDVIAWQWGGLSMAGWNAVFSTILALISLAASVRVKGEPGQRNGAVHAA
jgi:disulfide bond formation protein DsbB